MAYSFSQNYNTRKVFNVDTTDFEYKSLEELYHENEVLDEGTGEMACYEIFPVCGIYLNKRSEFGPQAIIATEECYVNLPSHLYDTCVDILADKAAINAINAGKVSFTIEKYYQKKFKKDCYSIVWQDK